MTTTNGHEHPDFEQWVQYREGQLTAEDEDVMQEHLAHCPRCTHLLLDLEDFLSPPEADTNGALSFEKAAVWRAVRPPQKRPSWYIPSSLAAAFLVGVLALGAWTSGERQELKDLRQVVTTLTAPQPNSPIYHLVPTTRSAQPARHGFPLAQEMQTFTLVFNLVSDDPASTFRADLIDTEGNVALSVPDLELDDYGTLTLGLSRKSIEPGDYLVHVYGLGSGEDVDGTSNEAAADPVASYTFRLETP